MLETEAREGPEKDSEQMLSGTGILQLCAFHLSAVCSFSFGRNQYLQSSLFAFKGGSVPSQSPATHLNHLRSGTLSEVQGLDGHKGGDLHPHLVFC